MSVSTAQNSFGYVPSSIDLVPKLYKTKTEVESLSGITSATVAASRRVDLHGPGLYLIIISGAGVTVPSIARRRISFMVGDNTVDAASETGLNIQLGDAEVGVFVYEVTDESTDLSIDVSGGTFTFQFNRIP